MEIQINQEDLTFLSISEAALLIRKRKLSPVELIRAVLQRIDHVEPKIHAFITLMAESALAAARAAEREIARGKYRGSLHGIPVGVKDTHYTKGIKTTAGTAVLADFIPGFDATVVKRLRDAGVIFLGKTNLPEFSLSGFTPGTQNPWDLLRTPGGSSGGSAAAVAAGMVLGATGGDTSGSIRGPATYCGVVGLKPTYGRVSRYGITTISWTLDHVGPMTRTVEDNAIMLNVLAGYDPDDASSSDVRVPDYVKLLKRRVKGLKIGIPKSSMLGGFHGDVMSSFHRSLQLFKRLGVKIKEVELPFVQVADAAQRIIRISEASSYHEKFLKMHADKYGPSDVRKEVETGSLVTAVQYLRAQKVREAILREMKKLFTSVDLLVTPGKSEPAGEPQKATVNLSRIFDLFGLPALALPCGFSSSPPGLPLGLQIVARPFEEGMAYALGYAYQSITDWHKTRPPL